MKIISRIDELIQYRKSLDGTVGFVPTMGFLHEGHLSLVDAAKRECQHVFVSIFVNPTQFGPSEDLSRYPRDFEGDRKLLDARGIDCLFFPQVTEMYPEGYQTYVTVNHLSRGLCGSSRPDHFRGVATVVLKLFNIVRPDSSFFGQKDAQQCAVVRRMVKDLNLDVKIRTVPIVRDRDGLALSSRNKYLSSQEKSDALFLPRTLKKIAESAVEGKLTSSREAKRFFSEEMIPYSSIKPDYIEFVDPLDLHPVEYWSDGVSRIMIAAAVWVGSTRLIDNILVDLHPGNGENGLKI